MIKNVLIFTLLQIYVREKKYDLRKGGGDMIFNVIYRSLERQVFFQSETNQIRYLVNWVPRLRNKRLFVEGDILEFNQSVPERIDKRWVTSKIVRRVSRLDG